MFDRTTTMALGSLMCSAVIWRVIQRFKVICVKFLTSWHSSSECILELIWSKKVPVSYIFLAQEVFDQTHTYQGTVTLTPIISTVRLFNWESSLPLSTFPFQIPFSYSSPLLPWCMIATLVMIDLKDPADSKWRGHYALLSWAVTEIWYLWRYLLWRLLCALSLALLGWHVTMLSN